MQLGDNVQQNELYKRKKIAKQHGQIVQLIEQPCHFDGKYQRVLEPGTGTVPKKLDFK